MNKFWFTLFSFLVLCPDAYAQARAFPDRAIRIVVHVSPGSGADTVTRFFAEKLAGVLGQPVIVENRPSANGAIAVMAVKSAPADGYTILLTSISTLSVNPIVTKDLPYDPIKDLKPISGLVRFTSVLVVAPDSNINSVADLVAVAKRDPRAISFGSYSAGYRLVVEWLGGLADARFSNIPYKGAAQMLPDVMGARLNFAIVDLAGADALIKAEKLRALAVLSEKRHPRYAEIPTVSESGYPECVNYPWTALHVRAETPAEITAKLADSMQNVLSMPESREYVAKTPGTELMPLLPAAMQKYHRDEYERFRQIAQKAGIRPE